MLEKGATEQGKEEDYEEEEGGITFRVRCSSTPEEKKDRKFSGAPLLSPPVTPTLPGSSSIRSDIGTTARHVTEPNFLAQPTSIASTPTQNLVPASTSSSCGSVSSPKTNDSFWLNLNFLPNFVSSVQNPGKCQSSTFSTYTFTTCRILHPSDVTQVTPR